MVNSCAEVGTPLTATWGGWTLGLDPPSRFGIRPGALRSTKVPSLRLAEARQGRTDRSAAVLVQSLLDALAA